VAVVLLLAADHGSLAAFLSWRLLSCATLLMVEAPMGVGVYPRRKGFKRLNPFWHCVAD
jgi:hypothetical protein